MAAETNWADAFNNTVNTAGSAFKTYTDAELAQQRQELLARNPSLSVNPTTGNIQQSESMFSTRNILLYAGGAVALYFLYKFAKKNKYI